VGSRLRSNRVACGRSVRTTRCQSDVHLLTLPRTGCRTVGCTQPSCRYRAMCPTSSSSASRPLTRRRRTSDSCNDGRRARPNARLPGKGACTLAREAARSSRAGSATGAERPGGSPSQPLLPGVTLPAVADVVTRRSPSRYSDR